MAIQIQQTGYGSVVTGSGKETATFEIDTKQIGFLRGVRMGNKKLVDANVSPPLFASLLESRRYDGFSDFIDDAKVIPATYHLDQCTTRPAGDGVEVLTTGHLDWPGGDAIHFEMRTTLHSSGHVHVSLQAQPRGEFRDRFLREFGLSLPLSLHPRKRVVQGGDRGIRFDTRSLYQYHAHVKFLEAGDFNFWQHFHVDQSSPTDYHLWRSESLSTSGLTEFRGRLAPGWMTAYDQQGGVLLSYKEMPAHAPKSLYVNARDGGRGVVYFHAPTHRALDIHDRVAASRVFDCLHRMDWIFFQGEEARVHPDRVLGAIWNVGQLASEGSVCADPELDRIDLLDAKLTAGVDAPLVVGGVPLPRGSLTSASHLSLSHSGRPVPLQARPTAYWPDGSIKWVLLIFPLDTDKNLSISPPTGSGRELPLTVTLRKHSGPDQRIFLLHYGDALQPGQTRSPLTASESTGCISINTGPLELRLERGQQWLKEVKLNGRPLLRTGDQPITFADFLRSDPSYPPNTTHPSGQIDDGGLTIDKIELEEAGPLRAMVRLEGMTTSQEPMRVILRLEAYAGRSYVRVFHSIEFLQKDPRTTYLRMMGLHLPLALDPAQAHAAAGGQAGVTKLTEPGQSPRLGLTQDSYMHFSAWRHGTTSAGPERFRTVMHEGNRSRGWLDIADAHAGLAVVMRNMWQEAPAELVVSSDPVLAFNINLWPESGPLMDVRRYSNYPHIAQGEDCHDAIDWVTKHYYPEDAFVGTSKTHEMLWYFHDGAVAPAAIDSLAADFQRPPLIYAGAKWYADTQVILPTIAPGDSRYALSDRNLDNGAAFILFHQKYWNWYGFWDYGDIGHMFKRGYGKFIPPPRLVEILKLTPEQRALLRDKELGHHQDYWPQHDWAYDNGRWGWGNTESLPNLFMQNQYFRTGDRDIYFFTEANARQVRDVTMRHAGRFFGYGTRHGVQHWSDGNHEQRQTTHTEFRYQYYLSGDMRSADFSKQLADEFYMKAPITNENDADHSARLYGLLTRWEMTHDPKYAQTLANHIHSLCVPEGIAIDMPIKFPSGTRDGQPTKINNSSMFFLYFGTLHALLEYYELTHDGILRDALIKYADRTKGDIVDGGQERRFGPLMTDAFAARYADSPEIYRRRLAERLKMMHRMAYQTVPDDRAYWTGLAAPVIHFSIALFWLNEAAYVMTSLEKEPSLLPRELQILRETARYSGPLEPGQPTIQIPVQRESWQREFDDPKLRSYTAVKRPLEP